MTEKQHSPLTLAFLDREPRTAARVLESISVKDAAAFLNDAPSRLVAPAVCAMIPWSAARCIEDMKPESASGLLRAMNYSDAVSILRLVDLERRDKLLSLATKRFARSFRNALIYPREAVGAWMDVTHPSYQGTTLVREAAQSVRRMDQPFSHLFITDTEKQFYGVVPTADLFRRDENAMLSDIADRSIRPLSNRNAVNGCVARPEWDHLTMLPVVGRKNNFLGVLERRSLKKALLDQDTAIRVTSPGSVLMQLVTAYMNVGAAFANLTLLQNDENSYASSRETSRGRKRKNRHQ